MIIVQRALLLVKVILIRIRVLFFFLNFGEIYISNSDEILAVGSCWDENQHKKAEILNVNSHTWLEIDDYHLGLWYQYLLFFFYKIKFIPLLSQWLQL